MTALRTARLPYYLRSFDSFQSQTELLFEFQSQTELLLSCYLSVYMLQSPYRG